MTEQEDIATEESLLGAILLNEKVIPEVASILPADAFYTPKNQIVYDAALAMFNRGEPVDASTIAVELDKAGTLRKVGGAPRLLDLIQAVPTATNATFYAQAVKDKHYRRELASLGTRIQQAGSQIEDAEDAVYAVRSMLDDFDAGQEPESGGFVDLYEQWVNWMAEDRPAIPTPWMELNDRIAGGSHKQHLYMLGARPGSGKTVMLSNIALYAAQSHFKTMFFSLELPKEILMGRILAAGARVPYKEITSRRLTESTQKKIHEWSSMMGALQETLRIDDVCDRTIEDIAAQARLQKQSHGLDLICIDYAQRMQATDTRVSREQQVAHIVTQCKTLARKLDVPVWLAAQLNRDNEKEGKHRLPRMSDFRESGAAEHEADVAIMLSRPPEGSDEDEDPVVNVTLAKNRTGEQSTFQLLERFNQQRFG